MAQNHSSLSLRLYWLACERLHAWIEPNRKCMVRAKNYDQENEESWGQNDECSDRLIGKMYQPMSLLMPKDLYPCYI